MYTKIDFMNCNSDILNAKLSLKWTKIVNSSMVLFSKVEINTEHGYTNLYTFNMSKNLDIVFQINDDNTLYLMHDSWLTIHNWMKNNNAYDHPISKVIQYLNTQDYNCHKFANLKAVLEFIYMFMQILAV